jgi:hypothetical protein
VKTSPGLASSSVSSAVISLVVLAIERSSSGRLANMTVPSTPSTRMAAWAVGTRGGECSAAATGLGAATRSTATRASMRLRTVTRAA